MGIAKKIGIGIVCALISKIGFTQQLRLGKNPYTVEKSAVLELVSDNQGLLLPRIADTTSINALNPPDGMIIYYSPSKQLLIRSNGHWKVAAETGSIVTSLNGNTGALTMDTSYISSFYSKVRSLFSATAPITYSNGTIGITQAGSSGNGYLSSTDWNTFNNKQSPGNYLVDPGGNGIVARTALNTTANRTIAGTSNRVDITNGNGVSGNPTIDISSSYVGQNTITTLGTVSTGTWNGGIISGAYGGTGINNGIKTITLGNNFTTSGNFALTLTQTGTTNVTLPITGTLATLNGTETFSNKILDNTNSLTIKDANLILQNSATTSKQVQFDLNSISAATTRTWAFPDAASTFVGTGTTQTLTNKTLTNSNNILGSVTMSLGSDATGDIYYRNSSGVLTRLGIGSNGQFLNVSSGLPAWTSSTSTSHNFLSATHTDVTAASVVRGDIITGQGASPTWSRLAIGSQGQILQAGTNEVGYTSYKLPISAGTAGQQLRTNGTDYVNKTTTTYQATPADPPTTTSTTGVMMGLTGSIAPGYSGTIMITISGDMDNNGNNNGVQTQIRYGTGSAPANGAALTGTTAGGLIKFTENNSGIRVPFHCNAIVTGLTVGTTYWIDLSLASITGGTSRVRDISISVVEL